MKVLLVYPVIEDDRNGRSPIAFRAANMVTSYLAALFPREVEVEIIDEYVEPMRYNTDADMVGISILTPTANYSYEMADKLRKLGKTVIAGGIHPSVFPIEAAEHFDSVVIGEAETVIDRIVKDFKVGKLAKFYRGDTPASMENLPTPRWDLLKKKRYIIPNGVLATRGCPYSCSFCGIHLAQGKGFRKRPIKDVVEEIEKVEGKRFIFWDDNLTADQSYALKLFNEIAPLKKTWTSQTDFNVTENEGLLKASEKSGCVGYFIGVETISNASLEGVHKYHNHVLRYKEGINRMHQNGLSLGAGMVVGFDHDPPHIFEDILEFSEDVHLDAAYFKILTPYPGTRMYDEMFKSNRILTRDWSRYLAHRHVIYKPALMKPEELEAGFHWMTQNFYSLRSMMKRMWGAHAGKGIKGSLPVNLGYWIFYHFLAREEGWNPAEYDYEYHLKKLENEEIDIE